MDDVERLKAEAEDLRREALNQMEGWQNEKQETERLKTIVTRFRHKIAALEDEVEGLKEELTASLRRGERLERRCDDERERSRRLAEALERYGQHRRGCKGARRPEECSCGLAEAGGAVLPSDEAGAS